MMMTTDDDDESRHYIKMMRERGITSLLKDTWEYCRKTVPDTGIYKTKRLKLKHRTRLLLSNNFSTPGDG